MKINTFLFSALLVLVCGNTDAQSAREAHSDLSDAQYDALTRANHAKIQGDWTTTFTNKDGQSVTAHAIVTDGYLAETFYNEAEKRFDFTIGGSWTIEGTRFNLTYEFNSADSAMVGSTNSLDFDLKEDVITFVGDDKTWIRVDHGNQNPLAGAWLITGRRRNGEMTRSTPGTRKTMKILSDTRFQWIAYDTSNGKFRGTGGGTYTTENGKYIESIEFFSRDNNRVGANLSFDYVIKDGEWHHSGYSSKGDPIYEIWTKRKDIVE